LYSIILLDNSKDYLIVINFI